MNFAAQIRAIRHNDNSTLRALYVDNYRQAEKYIVANSGSPDEARDIFQEAFIAVWRNIQLGRFEPQHENSLNSYLMQVVRNKWLDHLRSARHRMTVPLTSDHTEEELTTAPADEQQKINSVKLHFQQLGELCREVLRRFYYEKESLRAISVAFNWTEATARNNKYRCMQKLKELLNTKQYSG
jgi:RNA polymerase sigma factor (sigma-70 family)